MPDIEQVAEKWAKRAIRSEMVKREVTYNDLVKMLSVLGIHENERNLRNKIARGTFSAAFLGQCLTAIGCKSINIDLIDVLYEASRSQREEPTMAEIIESVRQVLGKNSKAKE